MAGSFFAGAGRLFFEEEFFVFNIRSGQSIGGEAARTVTAEAVRRVEFHEGGAGPSRGLCAGRNIVLVGFMGTGKTSTGRLLGAMLGRQFVDVDAEIEEATGLTVAAMFARGEAFFREQERKMIALVSRRANIVISTGGGAVKDPENIANLRKSGILVCLNASPDVIIRRLAHDTTRPLLNQPNRQEAVTGLLAERAPLYRQADVQIDTDALSARDAAEAIVAWLRRRELMRVK